MSCAGSSYDGFRCPCRACQHICPQGRPSACFSQQAPIKLAGANYLGPVAYLPSGPHHVAAAHGNSVSYASAVMQHARLLRGQRVRCMQVVAVPCTLTSCHCSHAGRPVGCAAAAEAGSKAGGPGVVRVYHRTAGTSAGQHHALCSHEDRRGATTSDQSKSCAGYC
jgi:hypothetical protein